MCAKHMCQLQVSIKCEKSWKFKVPEEGINKFGNFPSLSKCLHENKVWQIWRVSLKGKYCMWTGNVQTGYCYLGRSHCLPHVRTISGTQCASLLSFLLPEVLGRSYDIICKLHMLLYVHYYMWIIHAIYMSSVPFVHVINMHHQKYGFVWAWGIPPNSHYHGKQLINHETWGVSSRQNHTWSIFNSKKLRVVVWLVRF